LRVGGLQVESKDGGGGTANGSELQEVSPGRIHAGVAPVAKRKNAPRETH
jgi:hypothetical protein